MRFLRHTLYTHLLLTNIALDCEFYIVLAHGYIVQWQWVDCCLFSLFCL